MNLGLFRTGAIWSGVTLSRALDRGGFVMTARTRALGAGMVALSVIVGGCGSSAKTSKATVSTATSTTRSTTTTSTTTSTASETTLVAAGSTGVNFTVDGTYKGQTVTGPVHSGSLRCPRSRPEPNKACN